MWWARSLIVLIWPDKFTYYIDIRIVYLVSVYCLMNINELFVELICELVFSESWHVHGFVELLVLELRAIIAAHNAMWMHFCVNCSFDTVQIMTKIRIKCAGSHHPVIENSPISRMVDRIGRMHLKPFRRVRCLLFTLPSTSTRPAADCQLQQPPSISRLASVTCEVS